MRGHARSPDTLTALQDSFRDAVLSAHNGTAAGWLADERAGRRLAVYRNTVQAGLVEVLAAAFPAMRRIVGAEFFDLLALRFVTAAPPRQPQLSLYGAAFPGFVAAEPVSAQLPYLSDVARLEWARGECYFAADAPNLDPAHLSRLAPEALSETVLSLHPATRLVASRFPIHRIWQINQPEVVDVPAVDMNQPETAIVARAGLRVCLRAIASADAVMVASIAAGKTLDRAMAAAQERDAGFDLEAALSDHFIHGTFADLP